MPACHTSYQVTRFIIVSYKECSQSWWQMWAPHPLSSSLGFLASFLHSWSSAAPSSFHSAGRRFSSRVASPLISLGHLLPSGGGVSRWHLHFPVCIAPGRGPIDSPQPDAVCPRGRLTGACDLDCKCPFCSDEHLLCVVASVRTSTLPFCQGSLSPLNISLATF